MEVGGGGINKSRAGITPGPHLHRLKWRRLPSSPVSADALHIRYAFNFSFGYYGDADLRDSPQACRL